MDVSWRLLGMLILSRKKNETVQIGDGVAVTIIRLSGNKVRLGIVAPRGTRVLRMELDKPETSASPVKRAA